MIEKVKRYDMPEYFEKDALCLSCEERQKKQNQLVCDYCHENELKPEVIIGEY